MVSKLARLFANQLLILFAESGQIALEFFDGRNRVLGLMQQSLYLFKGSGALLKERFGYMPSYGLNTSNSTGYRRFTGDDKMPNICGIGYVRPATQLHGFSEFDHAHLIAVFLTKQRHGTHFNRLVIR